LSTESAISDLISFAACRTPLRQIPHFGRHHREPASLLPRPRRFHRRVERQDVGLERDPVDHPMMSEIFFELSVIPFMVLTTCLTTSPPRWATSDAPSTSWFACFAFSAFCFTVEVSSSIELAVSSRLEACSSVRCDRSEFPAAISFAAVSISSEH
jgi:hypothetical protein